MADRETRDFMNVESFSQLPFIRPAPPLPARGSAGAIRLFGKEFGTATTNDHSDSSDNNNNNNNTQREADKEIDDNTETSSRKFECHYCCRNFPTSQALGGHQNAHKRERQQAKRAHLQSAMVHDSHVYGLMNYSRLGSAAPPSWNGGAYSNGYSSHNSRLYGGYGSYNGHQQQPINGSPLALWRVPAAHSSLAYNRDRPMHQQAALFGAKDEPTTKALSSIGSSHQFRLGYETKGDHVSLDLHL